MDLSEALSFQISTQQSHIYEPKPQSDDSSPTPIKNRCGVVHCCSTPSAIFHYIPQSHTLNLYHNHNHNSDPIASIELKDVIHIACSTDGRLLLALHANPNGSATCLNVTNRQMSVRWTMDHVHSHTSKYGTGDIGGTDGLVAAAAVHRGPVHSLAFHESTYDCLLIDAKNEGTIRILHCQGDHGIQRSIPLSTECKRVLAATWKTTTNHQNGSKTTIKQRL